MRFADQWRKIEAQLPEDWGDVRLRVGVDESRRERTAAVLAPLGPGVRGADLVLTVHHRGEAAGPDRVLRAMQHLDRERIGGVVRLVAVEAAPVRPEPEFAALAGAWDRAIAGLPADWSDVYGELELGSTDYLDRAALLLAPINPARNRELAGYRFRCARRFGYGASDGMVRRCLERLDEESIRGEVRILRALADTKPVATQGPVWYLGGRAV